MMRLGAGPPAPCPGASEALRLRRRDRGSRLVRADTRGAHARSASCSARAPRARAVGAVDPRDFLGRDLVLGDIAPGKHDEGRVGADEAEHHQPPDVPDQGEAGDDRKERGDEAGRAVARHLDRLVAAARPAGAVLSRACCFMPQYGSSLLDVRQHREVEGRRRRGGRPFQRAPVPGIAGRVAAARAGADARRRAASTCRTMPHRMSRRRPRRPAPRDATPADRSAACAASCPGSRARTAA